VGVVAFAYAATAHEPADDQLNETFDVPPRRREYRLQRPAWESSRADEKEKLGRAPGIVSSRRDGGWGCPKGRSPRRVPEGVRSATEEAGSVEDDERARICRNRRMSRD